MLADSPRGGIERLHGEPTMYTEGLYSVTLNARLQGWEVEDAWGVIRWLKGDGPFFGVSGVMVISGPPRQGKGLFGNVLAWKIKRYFASKRVLRDDRPTSLFGEYVLFNEDTVMANIAQMSEVAEAEVPRDPRTASGKAALRRSVEKWNTAQGEVALQNSVLLKDEFWKDMDKRRPASTMNLVFGGFIKMWGHLDMLLLGIIQAYEDLDRFRCLPWVGMHAKCTWCSSLPDTTEVNLYHVRWSVNRQRA